MGSGITPHCRGGRKEAGLTNVHTSINRSQNMVAQYIATRPLLDLCEGVRQREGGRVTLRWWDQSEIDWEKAKATETETESASDSDSDAGADTEGEEVQETESRASGSSGSEWIGASADEWE